MSDDPRTLLDDIHILLTELWSAPQRPRALRAYDRLTALARPGLNRRGGSGGTRDKSTHTDPVLQALLDEASQAESARLLGERDDIVEGLKGALMKLQAVERRVAATLEPNAPINYKPGCSNCSTVRDDSGRAHWLSYQEVKARGLCGWCYRFQYGDGEGRPGYGVPPTRELLRWHLDHLGAEIPKTMMKDHMPEAWAERERRKREGDPGPDAEPSRSSAPTAPTWARPEHVAGTCAAERWDAGIDYRCTLAEDHEGGHDWTPIVEELSATVDAGINWQPLHRALDELDVELGGIS